MHKLQLFDHGPHGNGRQPRQRTNEQYRAQEHSDEQRPVRR